MEKPRILITTDMECDDMNSMIHLCLHLDQVEVVGIVYTASQYHFQGDGVHTLGQVTPHYRTGGTLAYQGRLGYPHPDPNAAELRSYRPFEEGWLEALFRGPYAEAYHALKRNSPDFPAPEELLRLTKYGNIAFEGDVREDTEGSNLIRSALLADDPRPLHLLSWGGANTIVRALLSIAEEYRDTPQWGQIYRRITGKAQVWGIFDGVGQDNSWADHARELYPDLQLLRTESVYGTYFAALNSPPDCLEMFRGPWLKAHIKFGHGPLLEKYGLFGDGTYYRGEPDKYQYGLHPVLDWGYDGMEPITFQPYDFLGEGDSNTYIQLLDVGLRGLENPLYGTLLGRISPDGAALPPSYDLYSGRAGVVGRFLRAYQQEWAARADWCVAPPERCIHPPVVWAEQGNLTAAPGEQVFLQASAREPDGRPLKTLWWVYPEGCRYSGLGSPAPWTPLESATGFTVPADAASGDWFSLIFQAQADVENPITRYAQVIVAVR